jgi:uncharacterized protein YndB with AHSA1/START domain
MTQSTLNETERMTVTRIFDAPRELVWKAWTDPHYARQWWGPKGFTTPIYRSDFRAGGKFFICMKSPDGQEFFNAGVYHEIVPPEKIVSSMFFADADGNQVEPEHYGIEHEAIEGAFDTTLFEDLGDGRTRLTFIGNEPMQEAAESGQLEGWNQILEKFAEVLASLTPAN